MQYIHDGWPALCIGSGAWGRVGGGCRGFKYIYMDLYMSLREEILITCKALNDMVATLVAFSRLKFIHMARGEWVSFNVQHKKKKPMSYFRLGYFYDVKSPSKYNIFGWTGQLMLFNAFFWFTLMSVFSFDHHAFFIFPLVPEDFIVFETSSHRDTHSFGSANLSLLFLPANPACFSVRFSQYGIEH